MTNPSPASLMAKDISHVVACARAVLPFADDIASAKSKLEALQTELGRTEAEVRRLRSTFEAERTFFAEERRRWKAEGDRADDGRRSAEADLFARLDAAKAELTRVQNSIAKATKKIEEHVRNLRRLQRQYPDMVVR
jgi:chromosome segregation ATPase